MTRKSHGPGPFLDGAEAWRPGAACRSIDTGIFYPSAGWVGHEHHQGQASGARVTTQIAEAKAVCATCPVRAECLAYALDINEADGVWGGTDPIERRAILKRRRLAS